MGSYRSTDSTTIWPTYRTSFTSPHITTITTTHETPFTSPISTTYTATFTSGMFFVYSHIPLFTLQVFSLFVLIYLCMTSFYCCCCSLPASQLDSLHDSPQDNRPGLNHPLFSLSTNTCSLFMLGDLFLHRTCYISP